MIRTKEERKNPCMGNRLRMKISSQNFCSMRGDLKMLKKLVL